MKFKKLHPNFELPIRSSVEAGGLDVKMPYAGAVTDKTTFFKLGFAAEVPKGHVALILPRSGTGAKQGLEVSNTCGLIDADYRGEWIAALHVRQGYEQIVFAPGDRLVQIAVIPVADITPELVLDLDETERGSGGFGSTGA